MLKKLAISLIMILGYSSYSFSQISRAPLPFVSFVLTPDKANWNYDLGQEATVKIMVLQNGIPINNVNIAYEFGPELMAADQKGTRTLTEGIGQINIGTSNLPSFRQLKVSTNISGTTYRDQVKLAFGPEKIEPTVNYPTDFTDFWKNALAESDKLPLDALVSYLPEKSTPEIDVFRVNIQNARKGKRLYGYLSKPKGAGKYPVLLNPPGAGIKPIEPDMFYANQGFMCLAIEIHGISPEIDAEQYKNISNAFGSYWFQHLNDKDNYYYKDVYLGCSRAIDFLCSLPEFDGKNVLVAGGSQGGALAMVTASLNKRVTALAAFYPALCDLTGYLHGRAGGWPHLFSEKFAAKTANPEIINNVAYFDVVNFAKTLKIPGFYSWGYNDNTCPPTSMYAAYNVITAPKKLVLTPISGHWRFAETNSESVQWLKDQCK